MTTTTTTTTNSKSFIIGQVMITPGAKSLIPESRVIECLKRHQNKDWGRVCDEDREANDEAVRDGLRVISAYAVDPAKAAKGHGENCFWIITEADRSHSTILLPSEY